MKKAYKILLATALLFGSSTIFAQTAGTLTFSFVQPVPTNPAPTESLSKSVIAVWIENGTGTFIKTKMRYIGSSTKDHLPSYSVKAGGTASNALTSTNVTDAATGATRSTATTPTSFGSKSITWDGKNVVGTTNGTTVADGVYKVWIESTWVDAGSNNHNVIESFSFTKGPTAVHLTPTSTTGYFNTIVLDWNATLSVDDVQSKEPNVVIYPVPSKGIFNLDLKNDVKNIKVYDLLGKTVYNEDLNSNTADSTKSIDLSNLENGNYIISLTNDNGTSNYEVIISK